MQRHQLPRSARKRQIPQDASCSWLRRVPSSQTKGMHAEENDIKYP